MISDCLIWNRCHGIDAWSIIDDNGELAKTVSVEDSFVRGSITTKDQILSKLEHLYTRLLRLLKERRDESLSQEHSFPRGIRLSLRIVEDKLSVQHKRRPFKTHSKQIEQPRKVKFSILKV